MPIRRLARIATGRLPLTPAGVARGIARRVVRRRFRRITIGSAIILGLAGAGIAGAIKMRKQDADAIQKKTGKNPEDMTEEELKGAMKQLGITKLELTPEDQTTVAAGDVPSAQAYCSSCGAVVAASDKFCKGCGAGLE